MKFDTDPGDGSIRIDEPNDSCGSTARDHKTTADSGTEKPTYRKKSYPPGLPLVIVSRGYNLLRGDLSPTRPTRAHRTPPAADHRRPTRRTALGLSHCRSPPVSVNQSVRRINIRNQPQAERGKRLDDQA
jgi:hypothetical protein